MLIFSGFKSWSVNFQSAYVTHNLYGNNLGRFDFEHMLFLYFLHFDPYSLDLYNQIKFKILYNLFIFDGPRFSWRQQMVTCVRSEMSTLIFFIPAIQILNSNQKFACDINVHMTLHSGPHYIW